MNTPALDPTPLRDMWNVIAVAIVALWCEQVGHELFHGVADVAFGATWKDLHLFAMDTDPPAEGMSVMGQLVGVGGAALFNIASGFTAWALLRRRKTVDLAYAALFFFGAYSLFAGFGYLMFDAIFFDPEGQNLGDWKRVIALWGGTPAVRVGVGLVGTAGYLFAFFMSPRFLSRMVRDKRALRALTWGPFFLGNSIATVLAVTHPLGLNGVILVALKYWMGFCFFFWGYFMTADRIRADAATTLAAPPSPRVTALFVAVTIIVVLIAAM